MAGLLIAGGYWLLPQSPARLVSAQDHVAKSGDAAGRQDPLTAIPASPPTDAARSVETHVEVPTPDPATTASSLAAIEAAMRTYSAGALPVLGGYLRHGDAEVRRAAREAMVQLGLAEGAGVLREAADTAADPQEALAMLDAAELLELPSVERLTPEMIESRRRSRAAAAEAAK
ncbi:MAG: hypothetical protein MUE42_13750 [Opitutaceae bacterium]|nr:hypothetical protein [Opitutaceae bacterium]